MKQLAFIIICFLSHSSSFCQLPSGRIASYQFNNDAIDGSGNNYNGSLNATALTTNRFGTANSATAFVAGSSFGTLPLGLVTAVSNNFTIGYWFKTSMTGATSTAWYGGSAMVDAEVCGGTSDWGTALIDGGKVCFGTGNPDITIKSISNYNNNAWHFVTVTRNMTTGTILLYVDGTQVASSGGASTVPLIAPPSIGLGRNPCSGGSFFTGSIDDIIAYDRVLTGTEVTNLYNHYNLTVLPLQWLNANAELSGDHVNLQWQTANNITNDHFEIERSTNGSNFSVIANVEASKTRFTDVHPAKGNNFYRIRQVDKDGRYSLSVTMKIIFDSKTAAVYLQANPVLNKMVLINNDQLLVQRVMLTDMSGRTVSEQRLHNNNSLIPIPMQQLLPGYYVVQITTASGTTTLNMVKQ